MCAFDSAVARTRGAGTGGGLSYGPVQNVFVGANIAAATTARNTYTTANADWVAQYNDNRNFIIELNPTTGDSQFFRRNSAGDDWEQVTIIVTGRQGTPGTGGGSWGRGIRTFGGHVYLSEYPRGEYLCRNWG